MTILKKCTLIIVLVTLASACNSGGSDGFDSGPSVRISNPSDDQTFVAGSTIDLELQTENFQLGAPLDSVSGASGGHGGAGTHNAGHMAQLQESSDIPGSGDGHYHIYLDEARDGDPHITAWSYSPSYQLPEDIESGFHTLRVELRDNEHASLGIEDVLFFQVE
jgi:hypothetical protein